MTRDDPTWSILRLPSGPFDLLEVYGAEFDDERLAPPNQPLFIAFIVADLDEAHKEMAATGHEIGDVIWAHEAFSDPTLEGFGWFFVRAPDELIYFVQQVPE